MLELGSLNYLAIALAGAAKFIIGGLWFSPILFGDLWLKETGLKKEELGSPRDALLTGLFICILVSFSFAIILQMLMLDLRSAMAVGVIIAIGITAAQIGLSFPFEGRSLKLFLIYATQCVAEFIAVVLILSLM